MKRKKSLDFLTAVLFVGILLSLTLYIGLGTALSADKQDYGPRSFNEIFYEDDAIGYFVKYLNYRVFQQIDDESIIIGREDWLFETADSDSGYDYLMDYVGGSAYTAEELAAIGDRLSERRRLCEEKGVTYLLVVIPNSMTICQEYLPDYLGHQSENTRLRGLSAYLSERGETSFLDLTDSLRADQTLRDLYNNTEDSLNAYGAYSVYSGILNALEARGYGVEGHRLSLEEIEFSTRYTEGKEIARKTGLERVIQNRTVSLTERMTEPYQTVETTEHCTTTEKTDGTGHGTRLVLELSAEWDKIQLMPYFSNTFSTVTYENAVNVLPDSVDYHDGDVLIQVIHESELELLLRGE